MADLQEWVGRTTESEDDISPAHARGLVALLDRDPDALKPGYPLPETWHWIFFRPTTPQSDVAADGHAKKGGFLPPLDLPRRMWVGGRIKFLGPLLLGLPAKRKSMLIAIKSKSGRSGELVFLTVRHEIETAAGLCIEEEQDLVYRSAPAPGDAPKSEPPPADAAWSERLRTDPVMLFRFSALTFNGHRIHYDQPFATGAEGYPGLVVHGPLTALLLMDAAKRHREGRNNRPTRYEYRAVSPLFEGEEIEIAGKGLGETSVWAAGPRGLAMTATVEWER